MCEHRWIEFLHNFSSWRSSYAKFLVYLIRDMCQLHRKNMFCSILFSVIILEKNSIKHCCKLSKCWGRLLRGTEKKEDIMDQRLLPTKYWRHNQGRQCGAIGAPFSTRPISHRSIYLSSHRLFDHRVSDSSTIKFITAWNKWPNRDWVRASLTISQSIRYKCANFCDVNSNRPCSDCPWNQNFFVPVVIFVTMKKFGKWRLRFWTVLWRLTAA